MLGLFSNLVKSAYNKGLSYVRDGLKLYMPYRGANHSEVKFVGSGSSYFTTDDYIDCGNHSTIQMGTSDFSICAWIKKDADGENAVIVASGRDDGIRWFFRIDDNNKFEMYSNDGTGTSLISASTITGTNWNHVALSWDRDSATGAKLYINGVLDAERDGTAEQGSLTNSSYGVLIGARRTTGSTIAQYWDGKIKNVGIWKRALTATEIQNVMYKTNDELSGRLTSNLVSWWSLESGQGDFRGSSSGTNQGSLVVTGTYGGNVPVIPRAIDNAPTVQADGIGIGSAYFDGSNAKISTTVPSSTFYGDFSCSMWVKRTVVGSAQMLLDGWEGSDDGFRLYFRSGDDVRLKLDDSTLTSNTTFVKDRWYHIAVVQNDTANTQQIYIDGVLDTSGTLDKDLDNENNVLLMGLNKDDGNDMTGNIAQVGIWSKAMTQAQVLSVMEKTYDEFNADDKTSLVSYWALDETLDGGSVVEDKVNSSLGSELFDAAASVFTSGTYSWVKYGNNTISNDSNALKMTHVDDARLAYLYLRDANDLSSNLTVGQVYKLTFDIKVSANSVTAKVYTGNTDPEIHGINDTSFTSKTLYFTASHATDDYILITTASGGMSCWIDNLSLKPVNGNQGGLV